MNTCDAGEELPAHCEVKGRIVSELCEAFGDHNPACTSSRQQLADLCNAKVVVAEALLDIGNGGTNRLIKGVSLKSQQKEGEAKITRWAGRLGGGDKEDDKD